MVISNNDYCIVIKLVCRNIFLFCCSLLRKGTWFLYKMSICMDFKKCQSFLKKIFLINFQNGKIDVWKLLHCLGANTFFDWCLILMPCTDRIICIISWKKLQFPSEFLFGFVVEIILIFCMHHQYSRFNSIFCFILFIAKGAFNWSD